MKYLYISRKICSTGLYQLLLFILAISTLSAQNNTALEKKFTINFEEFKAKLSTSLVETRGTILDDIKNSAIISLPNPDGQLIQFHVWETQTMESGMEKQYPDLHTYLGESVSDPAVMLALTITKTHLQGIVFSKKGNYSIMPMVLTANEYRCFYDKDVENVLIECANKANVEPEVETRTNSCVRNGSSAVTLRNFRMAIAATAEFTRYIYAQSVGISEASFPTYKIPVSEFAAAKAAVVTALTAMVNATNAIYKRELAISFTLVNNTNIIYVDTDPTTAVIDGDPMTPYAAGAVAANAQTYFTNNTATIPLANYDIGHVFHFNGTYSTASFGASGQAGSGPCSNTLKGRGWTQYGGNGTFPLALHTGVFVHEVAHQFGAQHTFNSTNAQCGGQLNSGTSYEPGAGSSLMSYSARCAPDNVGSGYESHFHTNSLEVITNTAAAATCDSETATGNNAPSSNANPTNATYIIPKNTAFSLTGAGTDTDGDALTYSWEQYDAGGTSTPPSPASAGATLTSGPIFRSFPPVASPTRDFTGLVAGEYLSQVARTLNFRLTVRDNKTSGGGIACDAVSVQVVDDIFQITSQNTATAWIAGRTVPITWNTSGANGSGANCANLDFLFSTDGGLTYTPLLTNTPNDGTQTITVPSTVTTQGRIKMKCTGSSNIFYDINDADITILSACTTDITTITPSAAVSALAGDAALNLGLSGRVTYANFNGTLASSDASSNLFFNDGSGMCSGPSNNNNNDTYTFIPTTNGSYTFTKTGSGVVLNLYMGSFNNSCTGWLASNSILSGGSVNIGSTLTYSNLMAGVTYTLVVSSFSSGFPTLPANYTVSYTTANNLYKNAPTTSSFAYTYVVVNNATNKIVAFNNTSDLTNAATYPAGTYTVYGLSYLNSEDLSSYVGQPLSTLQTAISGNTICASLSTNNKMVTITGGCATITTPSSDQTICIGSTGTNITVSTNNNVANGIKFVKFTTDQVANNATPTATELTNVYGGTAIATVTPSSGTATYTFNTSDFPNATNAQISYYVYGILNPDAGASCRPFQEIKVIVNPLPTVTGNTLSNPTTCNGTDGKIILTGVTPPSHLFSISYKKNGTSVTTGKFANAGAIEIGSLGIGTYTDFVLLNEFTNCSSATYAGPIMLANPAPTAATLTASTTALCVGDNFNLSAAITGGVSPYTLIYSDGMTNTTVNNYMSGTAINITPSATKTYSIVSITDANGCSGSGITGTPTVTVNSKPVITTQPVAQTKCVGTAASFTVAATTGTGTLTYQWQKNGANISGATSATYDIPSVVAADAGNYSVIISNNGVGGTCNITSSAVALAVDAQPTTASAGSNQQLCNTNTFTLASNAPITGTGTWSLVSGTGTITTPSSNVSTVTGVTPIAKLRWTISNGVCTPSTSDVILTNTRNPDISAIPASEVCFGATKDITVSASSGSGLSVKYTICDGAGCTNFGADQSSEIFTKGAGNYVVQVTDSKGCKATTPVSITQPSADLGITVNPKANVLCIGGNTGSLTLFPAGGTAPYTFRICKNCNTYADPKTAATTGDFVKYENLTAGIYNIEITDAKDCKKVISETITEPTTLTATVTPTPAANCTTPDGIINIVATGGTGAYMYELNGVSKPAVITGLAPTTYTVVVKDANGCTFTTMTTVTSPTSPTAFTVTSDSTKICVGQSTKIKVSGSQTGVTYQLLLNGANLGAPIAGTSAAIEFTNISGQGTYSVKATDAANCMTTMSGMPSLLVNPYSPAPLVTTPVTVCKDGTYTITPTANATYPIEFLYDFAGNSIAPTISGTGAPLAFGYSVGTNATGGFAGGAAYTVSGINSGATDKFIEFQVSPFNAANLTITDISFDILKDADGASAYELRSSLDGFTAALSTGTIATSVVTKTIAGSYIAPANGITFRLYLTGSNTNAGIVTIDNIKLKGTTALPGTLEYYSDAALTTKIGTGASQAINSASTPSTATTGAKKVYVAHRSAANCLSAATEVTINVTKPAINAGMDINICSGKTATLAAMGTGAFAWSGGLSAVANPTTPALTTNTTYTVTLTDANNCTATDAVDVNIMPLPTLTVVNPPAVCAPNTVNITAASVQTANDGTTTKYYSTNALAEAGAAGDITTQTAIAASGTYYIRSEFGNGCYIVKPVTVTIYPQPTVNAGVDVSICPKTTTILAAMGTGTFAWSGGLSPVANPTTPAISTSTTYTVTLTDANHCTATDAVDVNIKPLPVGGVGNITPICENQTATLTASGGDTYSWNKGLGTGSPVTTPALTVTTTYTVTIMGANGCSKKDSVEVRVNPLPTATAAATSATCIAGTTNANADGKITISGFTTEKYAYTSGNTYGGGITTFAAASAIPAGGVIVNNLANPAGATQQYTVRIFTANDCYIDRVITLNQTNCSCTVPFLTPLSTQIICVGGTFNPSFITTGSDIPVTYQWYNDNGSSNANSDVIAGETSATLGTLPTAKGEYIYRVEATSTANSACKTSRKASLFIRPIPTTTPVAVSATCIAGTSIANNDAKITLTDFGAFYKYDYKIGAGAFTGTLTPIPANGEILTGIANPASAVTYTVHILSLNNSGCFVDREVVLNPTVCTCTNPTLSALTNETICVGGTFTTANVTTSSNVPVTYKWYNDNGADNANTNVIVGQTTAALTVLPSATGVYKYKVEASRTDDATCKSTQSVSLTIVALPIATAAATSATCIAGTTNANSDGKITISGFTTEKYAYSTGATYTGGITTYAAATAIPVGGVIVSNLANPAGVRQQYTVRIFNGNDCYVDRVVTLNQTNCSCTAPVLATLTPESICVGGTFTAAKVTTSVTNAVAVTYKWYNDNGIDNPTTTAISGETSATLGTLPTTAGSYTYRVEATSTANTACKTSQSVTLIVKSIPTTMASAIAATCIAGTSLANNDAKITVDGGFGTFKYDYKIGAGAFTGTQTTIPANGEILTGIANPASAVTYIVRIFSSSESGCFVDRVVILNPAACTCTPAVIAPITNQTLCSPTTVLGPITTSITNGVAVTYQWYNDNGALNPNTNALVGEIGTSLTLLTPPAAIAGVLKYRVEATRADDPTCKSSQTVTITLVTLPTVIAARTNVTCTGATANSDGKIVLSGLTTEKYDFALGTTYSGAATYATATNPAMNALPNPAAGTTQDYTVRIFNSNNCFIDRIVTLEYVNCTCTVVATNTAINACATTFPGTIGLFNLDSFKRFISTTVGAVITFYPTLADAQAGTNIITNPTAYSSAARTVTAKVANAAGTCANFATITLQVFDCRMRLKDPCACRNNATTPTNGQFNETIEVEAPAGQTWFIQSVSDLYKPASTATNLVPFVTGAAGEQLMDLGPIGVGGLHIYQLKGVHVDAIGYDIIVENSLGATLSQARTICYYPRISVGNLPSGGCKGGGGPFTFNASAPNATISYELDGVALASASVGNLGVGNHTLTIIADAGAPTANNPNDPGCIVRQTVQFSIANPNLTPDCKGYMTLSLGNCQDKLYPQQLLNSFNVDISDLTLELRDKNNKILPNNFITPAQVGQEVYAKLTYGCNGKTCETTIFVQDNNAPTAYSPEDGVITCTQYRELLAKGEFTPKKLAELFGNFSANDNCIASLEIIESISTDSVRINDCVNRGFILRTFSAQERYGYRRIAKTTQKITFLNDQNFRVKFPSNQNVSCTETLTAKKPIVEGVGCENVQVNYRDEVFTAANIGEAKQCYKIIRHWTVINMCRFNPTRNNYLPEGDADINYDYSYVKDTIIANYFTDARGTALNDNVLSKIDATSTSGFSPLLTGGAATLSDKLTFNPNIIAGTRTVGFVVDGRIKEDAVYIRDYSGDGVVRYTQVLNIVDNDAPIFATCPKGMQTIEGTNFTNDCRATVTMETSATDNCSATDKITYSYTLKPFSTSRETDWIQGSTNRFSNQLPVTKAADQPHLMTWRATDACGNTRECTFPFRVLDAKKPSITAQNLSTTLSATNTLSVGVSKFVLIATDNCTPMLRLRFAFSENPNDTIRLFTCKDYPSNVVKIFAIDEAKNFATAEAVIRFAQTATSINCDEVSFSKVGGVINNPEGVPVKATTSILLDNQPSNIDDVIDSKFSFKLRNGGTYIVQPTRNNDLLNGVSTYDLIKIQQHILETEIFDTPYKIIAADVNKDGVVTLLDVVELRKAILKLSYSFKNNESWRFLQKNYIIKDKENPIIEELPAYYKLTNLNINNDALDFLAIKIGDVNGNAQNTFTNAPVVEERNRPNAIHFLVEDRIIQPNERIVIPIKADIALNLSGFQTTLHFEDAALAFEGFDANALPISNNNIGIFNGIVTMSWNTPTTLRVSKEEALFTLTFRAKKAMLLSEVLFSSSQYTVSEIYTLKNNDIPTIAPLEIAFTKNNEATVSDALYQNIPNPFEDETTISFRLAKAQKVTVSITDVTGKILKVIHQDAFAGYNELTINNLPTKGILYYHLETPTFKASKKMVSVR